ncbi:MAG TPA: class I SAM-dependent methyltransferase [Gemmatimonadaceae bacterium]|jgi:ubiquinone/menaquinone biosynthesis C-methylase UbiE
MPPVDYDDVAATYDQRYARQAYDGVTRALLDFIGDTGNVAALEIGCGTGHWLRVIAPHVASALGVDRSWEMLQRARGAATALLIHAAAEQLPLADAQFGRAFCVNALHHFADPAVFMDECRRVLRPGGALLTIGLDPHSGEDQWWIYDYFPGARAADRERYRSTNAIREMLLAAGFVSAHSEVVQHLPASRPYERALKQGLLDRRSTSQLMVISDDEFAAGMLRLSSERPVLRADLRLYGTFATVPA